MVLDTKQTKEEKFRVKPELETEGSQIAPQEIKPEQTIEPEIKPESKPDKEKPIEKIIHTIKKKDDKKSEDKLSPEEEMEAEEVEDILEEDLKDVYVKLEPGTQKTFRVQGEETAKEIVGVLHHIKIKTKLVIKLIVKWLSIIPGISKIFIEQEAKLKTDKIVEMHEHEHENKNTK